MFWNAFIYENSEKYNSTSGLTPIHEQICHGFRTKRVTMYSNSRNFESNVTRTQLRLEQNKSEPDFPLIPSGQD